MRKCLFVFALSAILVLSLSSLAEATAPKSLGKFGYWTAYQMFEGPNPVCYMSITAKPPPAKTKTKTKARRGEVVLMITQRPAENALDVISYAAGMKFKPASNVTVQAGGKKFDLFTKDDTAWSRDSATDRAVTAALRSGASVTISGTAASGEPLADTVNLKGAGEAYYAIGKACGLPVSLPKAVPSKPSVGKATVQKKKHY